MCRFAAAAGHYWFTTCGQKPVLNHFTFKFKAGGLMNNHSFSTCLMISACFEFFSSQIFFL